jgi:hypothetical protein
MNLWGKEVLNPPVSSGVRRVNQFVCSWCVLCELLSSPTSSTFDSSFLACFDSFLLYGFDQWYELKLSTEGFASIPHEIIDQSKSRARVRFWGIFVFLRFSIEWLQIERWPLRGSSSTALWSCSSSFVAVGEDLATNRKIKVRGRFSRRLCSSVYGGHGQSAVHPLDSPEIGVQHVQSCCFAGCFLLFDRRTVR